ncbi:RHS repeat domain-containing protein, partial [Cellulosimicrobium funkei]|uniref:RHS repeat domain-containing protein n=1 Tax=Cellulosimicrobium funkei TaxID=264251 RepID=UPI0036F4ECAE
YLYDASGELLIRRAKGDGDTVLYLPGGNEIRLTTKGTTKTLSGTRYYTANGQTIAVRTAVSGASGTKLNFLAADHHGTSSILLDATTYAVTKRYSTPFGDVRGTKATTWPDDKAFLGKPADASTGLTHVGAREYDPSIGQFVSVDPLLTLDQHQSLNGYAYANQHPATSSDPTGLCDDPVGNGHCRPGKIGKEAVDPAYPPNLNPSHDGTRGSVGRGGGTASADSSGSIYSGPRYSCTGMSPTEMCKVARGPGDKKENKGNNNPYGPFDFNGPQPELGIGELLRRLIEGPVCNPGYPCEDAKYNTVPVGPGGAGRPKPGPPRGLPVAGKMNPEKIRYTQDSIKGSYKDGRSLDETVAQLRSGEKRAEDIAPIRVFERDGNLYSLDNRRLYAFKEAGVPVQFV